ncbi:MAG: Hsp70 family protein [Burkholderiales bacterium]
MSGCGLDFGTSNSGVALVRSGRVSLARVEEAATALPSAIFFPADAALHVSYGRAAMRDYLDGTPGRLMRSLKSLLGSRLVHERTAVGDRSLAFTDILTLYLRMLRERAEEDASAELASVVLGRPVRFVDDDAARDADAQATLEACARDAGFRDVAFQLEPIAAAFDYERSVGREESVLVVDVGGGTADFTVIRVGPGRHARVDRASDVLANDGVHIAGTDFDTRLHLAWVMPLLGYGATSPKGLAMPSPLFFDLSTWHRINLLYGAATRETLRELRDFFADANVYARLCRVVQEAMGHDLLTRTEAAKIALSDRDEAAIDLAIVEAGLMVVARRGQLEALLADLLARLRALGLATVRAAGLRPESISTVYFTGGSSGMTALREAFAPAFPESRIAVGDLFGSVVSGLGIDAARRFA